MITYIEGSLFLSPAQTLVNTVNTVGVMGRGIARDFRAIYPDMFARYQQKCEKGEFDVGQLMLYPTPNKLIVNFPTKRHWRSPSKIEYIEAGLQTFVNSYADFAITSVAFPQLGCGNGELPWDNQVRPLMEKYLSSLPIDILIHLYDGDGDFVEHVESEKMRAWLRSEPRSLPFSEVWQDISALFREVNPNCLTIAGHQVRLCSDSQSSEDNGLSILVDSEEAIFQLDEIRDIWFKLRNAGFLTERDLPTNLRAVYSVLFEILVLLPYVTKAHLIQESASGEVRQAARESVGLQYVPAFASPRTFSQVAFL